MATSTAIQNGPKSAGSGTQLFVSGLNCANKFFLMAAGKNPVPCGPRDGLEIGGKACWVIGAICGCGAVVWLGYRELYSLMVLSIAISATSMAVQLLPGPSLINLYHH